MHFIFNIRENSQIVGADLGARMMPPRESKPLKIKKSPAQSHLPNWSIILIPDRTYHLKSSSSLSISLWNPRTWIGQIAALTDRVVDDQ